MIHRYSLVLTSSRAVCKIVHEWVHTVHQVPKVIFWHCDAGCDRTGEGKWRFMSSPLYSTVFFFRREVFVVILLILLICMEKVAVSGAYYVRYQGYNISAALDKDVKDCGREPSYFSRGMLGWYCLYYEKTTGNNIGNCLNVNV